MYDPADLYQQLILDHNKSPRNRRRLEGASSHAEGYNPLCGDRVTVYVSLDEGGVVEDIAFEGSGCAISTAAASMMTQSLKGKTVGEANALFEKFHSLLAGDATEGEAGGLSDNGNFMSLFSVFNLICPNRYGYTNCTFANIKILIVFTGMNICKNTT